MNQFSDLTLTTKDSILENITLHEHVDINVLEKLINSTLLKETFNNPFSAIHKTERNQLMKYKSIIKENQYAEVKYNRVKGMDCGRVNPKNSLGLYSSISFANKSNSFDTVLIKNPFLLHTSAPLFVNIGASLK